MTKSLHRHYKSHGKERRKRCVFRRLQKTGRDGADVTWRGRSFQVRVATTGKGRSPTVDSRVRRTDSDDVDASYCSPHSIMHGHPHFRTTSQSLCGTLSHMSGCGWRKTGRMLRHCMEWPDWPNRQLHMKQCLLFGKFWLINKFVTPGSNRQ